MKTTLIFLFSALCFVGANQATSQSIFDQWPQLNDYHSVMSSTFHPAEEDDLEPLKTKSGELSEKAAALAKADIPEQFLSDDIKDAVKQLAKDSKSLDKMVNKGKSTDVELKAAIYDLHDVFHKIVGLCRHEDH